MLKKHIALADTLRKLHPVNNNRKWTIDACNQWADTVDALCKLCCSENPRFNEVCFRDYIVGNCGPNGRRRRKISTLDPPTSLDEKV